MFENRKPWADKAFWWVAPIVIVAAAGGGAYYYFHSRENMAENKVKTAPTASAVSRQGPAIRHQLPGEGGVGPEPLPTLNESDAPLRESLERLFGDVAMQQMLVPEDLVRHIVVTVDNLPRQKVAVEKRPLKAVPGQTAVVESGDTVTLSERNYARYAPIMRLVQGTDTRALADLYIHFYPLFQKAYEDLGYPGQYFNDRLVEAIDDLLAAPELAGPVALVQPRVFYEFADPKLEGRSAGQKVLIRMGRENAAVVKAKLRELRAAVTGGHALPSAAAPQVGVGSAAGGQRNRL